MFLTVKLRILFRNSKNNEHHVHCSLCPLFDHKEEFINADFKCRTFNHPCNLLISRHQFYLALY